MKLVQSSPRDLEEIPVIPLEQVLERLDELKGSHWYLWDCGDESEETTGVRYTIGTNPGEHYEQTIAQVFTANVDEDCAEMMILANNYMPDILEKLHLQEVKIKELELKLLKAKIK